MGNNKIINKYYKNKFVSHTTVNLLLPQSLYILYILYVIYIIYTIYYILYVVYMLYIHI